MSTSAPSSESLRPSMVRFTRGSGRGSCTKMAALLCVHAWLWGRFSRTALPLQQHQANPLLATRGPLHVEGSSVCALTGRQTWQMRLALLYPRRPRWWGCSTPSVRVLFVFCSCCSQPARTQPPQLSPQSWSATHSASQPCHVSILGSALLFLHGAMLPIPLPGSWQTGYIPSMGCLLLPVAACCLPAACCTPTGWAACCCRRGTQ